MINLKAVHGKSGQLFHLIILVDPQLFRKN